VGEGHVNLVKLCVGIDSLEHLMRYRAAQRADAQKIGRADETVHVTRMFPKRADELLNGGSLYWVIKGVILARQKVLRLDARIGADGIRRCAIVMEPHLIQTEGAPRRPFQGWRYLESGDAPSDLAASRAEDDELPPALSLALGEIGLR